MADPQPQMNEPAARGPTGELLNQNSTAPDGSNPNGNPEPKTETDPKPEPKVEAKPEPGKAPEAYEPFKLPDGVELKDEQLTQAQGIFKELGLDQAAAQKLVDFHAAQLKAVAAAPDTGFDALTNEWKTKAEADPDIGAFDGAKALALKTTIAKGLDAIGDPALTKDFKAVMNLTGAGNNPAFIKVLAKALGAYVEGKPTNTNTAKPSPTGQTAPDAAPKSIASAMYPNLPA